MAEAPIGLGGVQDGVGECGKVVRLKTEEAVIGGIEPGKFHLGRGVELGINTNSLVPFDDYAICMKSVDIIFSPFFDFVRIRGKRMF